jgi:hypothetical protein
MKRFDFCAMRIQPPCGLELCLACEEYLYLYDPVRERGYKITHDGTDFTLTYRNDYEMKPERMDFIMRSDSLDRVLSVLGYRPTANLSAHPATALQL